MNVRTGECVKLRRVVVTGLGAVTPLGNCETATVVISNKTLTVKDGHEGAAYVRISADSRAWLKVLHKDSAMLKEIIFGKIRVKGPIKLLKAFGACFS